MDSLKVTATTPVLSSAVPASMSASVSGQTPLLAKAIDTAPATNEVLQNLKQKGHVFDGSLPRLGNDQETKLSTGYTELDLVLHGGLSTGQLHEIQITHPFSGENRMFRAPLAYADAHQCPVFWVNPPAMPSLQGMQCAARSKLSSRTAAMLNEPPLGQPTSCQERRQTSHYYLQGLDAREVQWSVVQILQSVKCVVLLIWHPHPEVQMVRSWQRTIQKVPNTFAMVISGVMPREARAYQTRIRLNMHSNMASFEVLKRQGGWPTQTKPEPLAV